MKKFLTIAILTFGIAGVATSASATDRSTFFPDYPHWAQDAFRDGG